MTEPTGDGLLMALVDKLSDMAINEPWGCVVGVMAFTLAAILLVLARHW